MTSRVRRTAAALLALVLAGRAAAWIPEPERAWSALAQSNVQSGRAKPLDFAVALVDASGAVAATGRLHVEPDGHDRLELVFADGKNEVHERDATGYRVTRDGKRVAQAAKLLPPLDAIQAAKATQVADALRAIGGDPAAVDLGIEGSSDCWVLGGRDPGDFEMNRRASVWVDQETEQPVRIDDGSGVRYRLLDLAPKGAVRFPSRIEIHADGWPIWRLDVATPATQGAGATTAP